MNQELVRKLEALHLNQNEARVYLALLEIGQTSAGNIIKSVNLHRSVVYEALDKLISKKLVFKLIRKNIFYFQATNPERLMENVENEREIIKDILPSLKNMIDEKLPEIIIHEGIESYRRFWLDSVRNLPEGSTDYVAISIGDKWIEYLGKDVKKYMKIKTERKIKWKMIVFDLNLVEMDMVKKNPDLNEYRLIKRDFPREGNYNVFNDDTLILHSIVEPMIIEIRSKNLAKVFRSNFDLLWELGEKIEIK